MTSNRNNEDSGSSWCAWLVGAATVVAGAVGLDPLLLPWILYVMERADREPTQEELGDVLFASLQLDKLERFVDEFERLAEAV